jgi:hypothetical protein
MHARKYDRTTRNQLTEFKQSDVPSNPANLNKTTYSPRKSKLDVGTRMVKLNVNCIKRREMDWNVVPSKGSLERACDKSLSTRLSRCC